MLWRVRDVFQLALNSATISMYYETNVVIINSVEMFSISLSTYMYTDQYKTWKKRNKCECTMEHELQRIKRAKWRHTRSAG